jgi:hypothetical protein
MESGNLGLTYLGSSTTLSEFVGDKVTPVKGIVAARVTTKMLYG